MTTIPLQWRLPKLTRDAVVIEQGLVDFFPTDDVRAGVWQAVERVLTDQLGLEAKLSDAVVGSTTYGCFAGALGEASLLVAATIPSHATKIGLLCEHQLAGFVVDRMLGGTGQRGIEPIPLTESEQGVLQYVLMQCLAAVHQACALDAAYHFRFDRLCVDRSAIDDWLPPSDSIVTVAWRLAIGEHRFVLQGIVPASFVRERGRRAMERPVVWESVWDSAQRFAGERVEVRVEGGACTVTPAELVDLAPGDVVLLDQCALQLVDGVPRGAVWLRVGTGAHASVRCAVAAGKRLTCVVETMD